MNAAKILFSLLMLVVAILLLPQSVAKGEEVQAKYAIAIHGGAGGSPNKLTPAQRQERLAALEKALNLGIHTLKQGGTSLDAVEKVIRQLEDDPLFNAGRGAVMNDKGQFELDSSIMDGRDRSCGAVAAVRTVKNPISLARLVMSETRHVLLASDGAEKFADAQGVPRVKQDYFRTEARQRAFEKRRAQAKGKSDKQTSLLDAPYDAVDAKGTVGCVALDSHGNIAAGTSTGGLMFKKYGRVGDSPIVGAGTYADNATCGVSGTGIGEQFIRNAVAFDVSARMKYAKAPLKEAVKQVIHKRLKPGDGGLIAVSHRGEIAMEFNTAGMARAAANSNGLRIIKLD